MKLLPLVLLLAATPPLQDNFQADVRTFEESATARLRAEAAILNDGGDVEAAQVFVEVAAWLSPGDTALGDAAKALAVCVRALEKAPRRRPDLLQAAGARTSDARYEGCVARVPAPTSARRAAGAVSFVLPGETLTIRSIACVSELEKSAPADVVPHVRILVTDDEVLVVTESRVKAQARTDKVLRGKADVPAGWAADLVKRAAPGTDTEQRLRVAAELLASIRTIARTIHRVNDHRFAAGLRPVSFSVERSIGCFLHARYLALEKKERTTGLAMHQEDAESKFRTPEGETAGRRGLIANQFADFAVDAHMSTLYHRIPLLHPGIDRLGIGQWASYAEPQSVLDPGEPVPGVREVRYPGADHRLVFARFAPAEIPNPLPDGAAAGFPVTLTFYGDAVPPNLKATLTEYGTDVPVPCHVSSPDQPANPTRPDNARSVCLIPKSPLKPDHGYVVRIAGRDDSGKERTWTWQFETQAKPFEW